MYIEIFDLKKCLKTEIYFNLTLVLQVLMRPAEEAQFTNLFGPPIKTTESPKKPKAPSIASKVTVTVLKCKLLLHFTMIQHVVVCIKLFVAFINRLYKTRKMGSSRESTAQRRQPPQY